MRYPLLIRHSVLATSILLGSVAILAVALSSWQGSAAKTVLVNVTEGELPPDTGTDNTVAEIVDDFKALGGKALKVSFAKNDSFGGKLRDSNKNWQRQRLFRFDAFSPAQGVVVVQLNFVHARSTDYRTRVVIPVRLQPGRNEVKIGIDEMKNENGSAADLADGVRGYISDLDGVGPTVYFSDIWLEGGTALAAIR